LERGEDRDGCSGRGNENERIGLKLAIKEKEDFRVSITSIPQLSFLAFGAKLTNEPELGDRNFPLHLLLWKKKTKNRLN